MKLWTPLTLEQANSCSVQAQRAAEELFDLFTQLPAGGPALAITEFW